ncbi:spermidine/putrescine ABC transporter substrate-binding protein [Deltaproteobacteria bacterium TL4]
MFKHFLLFTAFTLLLGSTVTAAQNELRIFIWSEYMDEAQMTQAFEKKTGIKVKLDLYESNEDMMAKLQAGGTSQYDLIVPSDFIVPSLINLKLIQKLDRSQLPNLKNLGQTFRETTFDPGNAYTVGWQWGTVGLMYNKKKIKAQDTLSWNILFDPAKNPGPFCMIDSVREMLGITLAYLGYDFNSTNPKELKAAAELLIKTKKRSSSMGFKGGVGGKNDVVAGVANAAIVYNGDAVRAIAENTDLAFIVPKEGGPIWIDVMSIPAQAPNPDAAHKWINWILEPEVGAALSNYNHYASPNEASKPHLAKEDLNNPGVWPTPETMKVLRFVKDLGDQNKIIDQTWTMVKAQ